MNICWRPSKRRKPVIKKDDDHTNPPSGGGYDEQKAKLEQKEPENKGTLAYVVSFIDFAIEF